MALEVVWSPRSRINFEQIKKHLAENWSEKEVRSFVRKTFKTLSLIQQRPYLYRSLSPERNIREAVISKQNILIYRIFNNKIEVLSIFDARQHPFKKNI